MPSTHSFRLTRQLQIWLNCRQRNIVGLSQPSHYFVLFGADFSGGRLVVDLLHRVADTRYGTLSPDWNVASLLGQRHFFPFRHIQLHQTACSDYLFGFKLSAADLIGTHRMNEPHRFMTRLRDRGYKVIYLKRRDLMRHAIALLKARHSKSRHIDPQALLATLKQLDEQHISESAIVSQVPHLTLTYENDLLDPNVYDATAQRLCQFLSLKPQQCSRYPIKLVHQKLSDLITNYDEVRATLESSDYAYVLTEASAKLVV